MQRGEFGFCLNRQALIKKLLRSDLITLASYRQFSVEKKCIYIPISKMKWTIISTFWQIFGKSLAINQF